MASRSIPPVDQQPNSAAEGAAHPAQKTRFLEVSNWLSEREWIPIMLETASRPRRLILKLDVDDTNIDYLENTSCEEIVAERERQYQTATGKFQHSMSFARDMAIQPIAGFT